MSGPRRLASARSECHHPQRAMMGKTVPQALAKTSEAANPAAATDPADFSAVALLEAYGSKRLSPVEAIRAVLDRVARREPELHALYALDPDGAVAAAKASARRWAKGEAL